MKQSHTARPVMIVAVLGLGLGSSLQAQILPNSGQQITPLAPAHSLFVPLNPGLSDNPKYVAGQAASSVVSPDGKTLLVLTSGFNRVYASSGAHEGSLIAADSDQFVFVFDIAFHQPVQKQVIPLHNTYYGIVFDPSGAAFYVSGGMDDTVHIFLLGQDGMWAEQPAGPVSLGHPSGVGIGVHPEAAGIAISADGAKLAVTNYYNDSISILTKSRNGWILAAELDLRPGILDPSAAGVPGGEYPFWVVIKGSDTAYVSSIRDREVDVIDISSPTAPVLTTRTPVPGQPNKMALNASQSTLYVAQDVSDSVGVIDTNSNTLVDNIPVTAPGGLLPNSLTGFKGNDTNSVTVSKDGLSLYVTNGWMNDVAVVQLGPAKLSHVTGLIPTGWYPNSVSFSNDGEFMYVVNDKSPTGANSGYCMGLTVANAEHCAGSNQYALQLIKAGLQSFPTPTPSELSNLTEQVAANNHFSQQPTGQQAAMMAFLHDHIQHIIYVIKENRTYDQVLGDLEVGNGDPSLTEFGSEVTPNQHALASQFVDLDNFYATAEVSMDGWPWSTAAHATDVVERQTPVEYADRGLSNDSEGDNRNINVAYPTLAERLAANPNTPNDPNVLPGTADIAAPDGPEGEPGAGFLWDAALRAGLTVRNYGFFIDEERYNLTSKATKQYGIPEDPTPFAHGLIVAYTTSSVLRPYTDPYFRGFDMSFPDYYRVLEWQRDFNANGLPNLTLLRLPHDHTGNYSESIAGVNTPELDGADNDYAVGLVVQTIAQSQHKYDTLIFVVEDDAQNGGDHVDAHRSLAFVVGPYLKRKWVDPTSYNTLSVFRTIEDILGTVHQNLNDALAVPMANVFDALAKEWTFSAVPSDYLCGAQLDLPACQTAGHRILYPTHNAAYWAKATAGMDFSTEDKVDGEQFNRILWKGLMGEGTYPSSPSGLDLRADRQPLLARYRANLQSRTAPPVESREPSGGGGQK